MKRFLTSVLLFVFVLLSSHAQASHIIGGEVRYEHVSGNTYRILLNFYGDCNLNAGSAYNTLPTLQPKIHIYRDSTLLVDSIVLSRTATPPRDASPTCPAYLNNTRCNGGTQIGIKVFEYAATFTLPAANPYSSCWRFVMRGDLFDASGTTQAGRTSSIDNIQNAGASIMYIYSTLNNLGGRTNSSPAFSTTATPYFCTIGTQTFNPGATDANNDVLTYRAINALEAPNGTPVSYNAAYPAPYRLAVSGAPVFNAQTGQMDFAPSQMQTSVVEYLTEEYRNGVRVGSIMREMTFVVLACNNNAPIASIANLAGGSQLNSTTLAVCKGQTLSFNLNPTDAQNDTIDVTASGIPAGATYFISSNGTRTPTSSFSWNTASVAVGTYNFYVTYADRACPIAARQTIGYSIVVTPMPQFSFAQTSIAGCNRKAIFQITSPAGLAQSIVIMQGAATVKSYAGPVATVITDSLAPGTYHITATTGNNCNADTTITIAAPSLPVVAVSQTPVSCFGRQDGSVTATASGGAPPYTYSWNTTPAQTTATVTGLRAGAYTVTVTDQLGCRQSTPILLGQPDSLRVQTTAIDAKCIGQSNGSATATVTGGTLPYSYSWNTTPVQNAPTATGLRAGAYTVLVTDLNGCQKSASVTVGQPDSLRVQVSIADVKCFGGATGSATASATGGTAPYTYSWNTTPVQTTATATGLPRGRYTVTVTDFNGCSAQASDSVREPARLQVSASVLAHNRCFGTATGAATVVASGGVLPYRYSWSASPPQNTQTATALPAGTYIVGVTDANNCTALGSVVILEGNALTATITVMDTPCANESTGKALAQAGGGAGGPYTYRWSRGNNPTSSTVSGLAGGGLLLTITDNNNCQQDFSTVVPVRPAPQISAGPDRVMCEGDSITLQTTGTAINWQWSPPDDLSCTNCPAPVTTTMVSRAYTVFTSFSNGCTAADTVFVQVLHRAGHSEVGRDTTICAGDTARLLASGGSAYQWMPAASVTNDTMASPGAFPQTTTRYTVIIHQNQCVADTLTQTVSVVPLPAISLGPDFTALTGATVVLNAVVTGIETIAWTPTSTLSCSNCTSPRTTLLQNMEYIATVTNRLGCTASDTLRIRVGCDATSYYVANTFTPDGDGMDDWFYPQGRGGGTVVRFEVYNRWGNKVFEAANLKPNYPQGGWNGAYAGQPLNPGVFTYVMEARCADGTPIYLKGDVTLIR